MDFIEKVIGVSPDGGDGSTELLYVLTGLILVMVLGAWRVRRRRNPRG